MKIIEKNIDELVPYENNARINDGAVDAVANSISDFGFKVPVIIDKNNVLVAGHTRVKAAKKLGLTKVPCVVADDLDDEQIKAFRIADNSSAQLADWDMEKLMAEIQDLDFDMAKYGLDEQLAEIADGLVDYQDYKQGSLQERFGVPPFSVLDTRQKYWIDRRNEWKSFGIKSGLGRDDALLGPSKVVCDINNGTSIFDPVLCEIVYKWFNVERGSIFDPFAGGSVRGVVAAKLGYNYTGIDLRNEQVEANKKNAQEIGVKPTWFCDDSLNVDKYIQDESVDLVFSCPPYADLEKYSDDARDLSNMNYEDFKRVYFDIIKKACAKLKNNRFACFVVGDVRDKNGFYYNFVDDTKKAFIDAGLKFYNEIILVNSIGSGALRANNTFKSRKVVKMHQNVLVFYKGNAKEIKTNYKDVVIENIEESACEC